jgi:hypothetical protein
MLRLETLILAVRRHLLLERSELGERRIGIGRTIALARRSARGILPMRRPVLPATAVAIASRPALVTALVPSRIVAITGLGPVAVFASLAVEAIARPGILVVPPILACGRAVGGCGNGALDRLIGARLVEITVTIAPAMPVTLTSRALAFFT